MLELKRQGQTRGVIVSGCLAEREKEALLEACPGVDQLVGVFGREHVTKVADRLFGGSRRAADAFFSRPRRRPLSDRIAAADHAAAFRVFENLGGLRSAVHVLRDSRKCAASTTPSRSKK